jgi:hypothetical protein
LDGRLGQEAFEIQIGLGLGVAVTLETVFPENGRGARAKRGIRQRRRCFRDHGQQNPASDCRHSHHRRKTGRVCERGKFSSE